MDTEGQRLLAKYYDQASPQFDSPKSQHAFERTLFSRTSSNLNNEVAMLNGFVALYKANLDLVVYVVGGSQQNELMLCSVLDCIFDTFSEILKPQMDKQAFIESYEQVILAIDETVDRGIILETDASQIVAKITKAPATSLKSLVERPLEKQSLSSAFKLAKEQIRGFW